MNRKSPVLAAIVATYLPLVGACGGLQGAASNTRGTLQPSEVDPTTPGQRALLERLDKLPEGELVSLEGEQFRPGEIYAAASGRLCRFIELDSSPTTRLTCKNGENWVFVPAVLGPHVETDAAH